MFNKLDKKNPFTVPENYFEKVNKEIMANISLPPQKRKVYRMSRKILSWSVAAIFIGVIVLSVNFLMNKDSSLLDNYSQKDVVENSVQPMLAASDEDEFFQYLEDETLESSYNEALFSNENL